MMKIKFTLSVLFVVCSFNVVHATDLSEVVSGADVEDSLGKMNSAEPSPYIVHENDIGEVEKLKAKPNTQPDFMFSTRNEEVTIKDDPRKKYKDFSYSPPGTIKPGDNYIELDKKAMAQDFRKQSSGAFNVTFIKNKYAYTSNNDVINETITTGHHSVKGGALYLRSDQYFFRSDYTNLFWSLGGGVGYNQGLGFFNNPAHERSDTTFKLWEIPIDAGLGLEIPIYHWFILNIF